MSILRGQARQSARTATRARTRGVTDIPVWSHDGVRGIPLGALVGTQPAFGGDDPLSGRPWYHEEMTREGARDAGWGSAPSDDLAWFALYIDMYSWDWTWRFRAAPHRWASRWSSVPRVLPALRALHVLDLFTPAQVAAAWSRISYGTVAAAAWAARHDDVPAARLAVGLGLHALQDFYAHSTWVDDPERRDLTWFDATPEQRRAPDLWTAGYACDPPAGCAVHGEIGYRPPGADTPRPARVLGSRTLARFTGLEAGAVTLDAPWMVRATAVARGFAPEDGVMLFEAAHALALRTTEQWLTRLDAGLDGLGHGAFWDRVRHERMDRTRRFQAVERPDAVVPALLTMRARSGAPEPEEGGAWSGLAAVRTGRRVTPVPLGPWPDPPDRVRLRGSRAVPVDGVEALVWRRDVYATALLDGAPAEPRIVAGVPLPGGPTTRLDLVL